MTPTGLGTSHAYASRQFLGSPAPWQPAGPRCASRQRPGQQSRGTSPTGRGPRAGAPAEHQRELGSDPSENGTALQGSRCPSA